MNLWNENGENLSTVSWNIENCWGLFFVWLLFGIPEYSRNYHAHFTFFSLSHFLFLIVLFSLSLSSLVFVVFPFFLFHFSTSAFFKHCEKLEIFIFFGFCSHFPDPSSVIWVSIRRRTNFAAGDRFASQLNGLFFRVCFDSWVFSSSFFYPLTFGISPKATLLGCYAFFTHPDWDFTIFFSCSFLFFLSTFHPLAVKHRNPQLNTDDNFTTLSHGNSWWFCDWIFCFFSLTLWFRLRRATFFFFLAGWCGGWFLCIHSV